MPDTVVRNTFIESDVDGGAGSFETKMLRRQSSEPILCYSSGGSVKSQHSEEHAPMQAMGTPTTQQESDSMSAVSSDDELFWGQRASTQSRGCLFSDAVPVDEAASTPFGMSWSHPVSPLATNSLYSTPDAFGLVGCPFVAGPSFHIMAFPQEGQHCQPEAPRFRHRNEQDYREQRGDRRDPRHRDYEMRKIKDTSITNKEPPWTDVTTVIMRNLPNKYHQSKLLEELGESGFSFQYHFNFFYVPMDHSSAANLGYCFINFLDTEIANAFAATFTGRRMRRFNSSKTVVVMPASVQGFDRNYAYYSSTRVAQADNPQYRPLFAEPATCVRHPPPVVRPRLPAQQSPKAGSYRHGGRSSKSTGEASLAGGQNGPGGSPNHANSQFAGSAYFRCEGTGARPSFESNSPVHGFVHGCPPPR